MCSMDTLGDANPPDIAHDGQIADVSPGNQVGPSNFPAIRSNAGKNIVIVSDSNGAI